MEPISTATTVWDIFNWILKKFGKKIVAINEYKDETFKIRMDYPNTSPKCLEEKNNGAEFGWSEYETTGMNS